MAYAFMSIQKIKSEGSLVSKYNHNCRIVDVENAIPELESQNEDLIELPINENGEELNYHQAFEKRISELPYYKNHNIRSNAVLGYELVLTYSRDDGIDIEEWKKQNVEWLNKTFNVAGDGKPNVLHAIFHADEVGNAHIHAFVVPIDEKGKLNAYRFTGNSRAMSDLQTSYGTQMEKVGLKRGLAGSSAKHQVIRKMYAAINESIHEIPDVKPGETAEEYKERALNHFEKIYASGMRSVNESKVKAQRESDEIRIKEQDAVWGELVRTRKIIKREKKEFEEEKKELISDLSGLSSEALKYKQIVDELTQQMYDIRSRYLISEEDASKTRSFIAGLEIISKTNPEEAQAIYDGYNYICDLGDQFLEQQKEAELSMQTAE